MDSKVLRITPLVSLLTLQTLFSPVANATIVTDSTSFEAFSITYDDAIFGTLKFTKEADSFSGTLPVSQYGYGRFFLDPGFSVSSDGSAGPSSLRVTGQIIITAKPGWGLYHANFTQSGQWHTDGSGAVSVENSYLDISAPNTQFFYNDHQAFTDVLTDTSAGKDGYYYVIGEQSTSARVDQLALSYDFNFSAAAGASTCEPNGGSALLYSDTSDPSYLGGPGPYPTSNIVGTIISIDFERLTSQ